jgi:hypothetical protein
MEMCDARSLKATAMFLLQAAGNAYLQPAVFIAASLPKQ